MSPRLVVEWVPSLLPGWDEMTADMIADHAMRLLDSYDPAVSTDLGYDPESQPQAGWRSPVRADGVIDGKWWYYDLDEDHPEDSQPWYGDETPQSGRPR